MSIETRFSPLTFPALRGGRPDVGELQARASGHAAGYAAGLRDAADEVSTRLAELQAEHDAVVRHGEARLARAIDTLNAAALSLTERVVPVLAEAQDSIAAAAIELAETIIGVEIADAETSARAALSRALTLVDAAMVQTVRMNPEDLALLDPALLEQAAVSFTADAAIGRGGAITEFADGFLDARIDTALHRAKVALLEPAL
ncbi:MAG: flagellar assembly protein [Homoserinimonas sp.]|jgi:flagellar assembly protein FliH|nr:flagellar assembly protein [Homoserinimonas sp.]